jgi:hypothetical protein
MKNAKKMEETIQRAATNTIGYTKKQATKKWFPRSVKRCTRKKTPPESEPSKITAEEPKVLTFGQQRRLFRKKAKQLDGEALIEIERHRSIQDSRKFYKRLNVVRRPFEPQVAMCQAKNEELLTNKN